jgi:hypothetical protein
MPVGDAVDGILLATDVAVDFCMSVVVDGVDPLSCGVGRLFTPAICVDEIFELVATGVADEGGDFVFTVDGFTTEGGGST